MALGHVDDGRHEGRNPLARTLRVEGDEQREVRGHLVIARAARVELAPERPDDLRQPPLDGHVDVLVVVLEVERLRRELVAYLLEAADHLRELVVGEHLRPVQGTRVGD